MLVTVSLLCFLDVSERAFYVILLLKLWKICKFVDDSDRIKTKELLEASLLLCLKTVLPKKKKKKQKPKKKNSVAISLAEKVHRKEGAIIFTWWFY